MIFATSIEILQSQLVFDCDNNFTVRRQEMGDGAQIVFKGVFMIRENSRILKHPDQQYEIKAFVAFEAEKVVYYDANISQLSAPFRGDARPSNTAFNRDDIRADFAQEARYCATAASQLENFVSCLNTEGTQQAVPRLAKVILANPIGYRSSQFRRECTSVVRAGNYAKKTSLRLCAVGV